MIMRFEVGRISRQSCVQGDGTGSTDTRSGKMRTTAARVMTRLACTGFVLALLGGCGFPSEDAQPPPQDTVKAAEPASDQSVYCFIPEGCDANGHHYTAGQEVTTQDTVTTSSTRGRSVVIQFAVDG